MTQYDLWKLTGINPPRISLAERGFIKLKEAEREAMSEALKVPIESFEFGDGIESFEARELRKKLNDQQRPAITSKYR